MRPLILAGLFFIVAGCGGGRGVVTVTVTTSSGELGGIDHLHVTVSNNGTTATPIDVTFGTPPTSIPPAQLFALGFAGDRKGTMLITVAAVDAKGAILATASSSVEVSPSKSAAVTISLPGPTVADLGSDSGMLDLAASLDFADGGSDQGSLGDSSPGPDLTPSPDLTPADLTPPADLLESPDLTPPLDLTLPPDLAPAPTCVDKVKNGSETDVDCGGPMCPKCVVNKMCGGNGDCISGKCSAGVCAALGLAFAAPSTLLTGASPISLAAGDFIFDGKGVLDLVVADSGAKEVYVFKNDGTGSFKVVNMVTFSGAPTSIVGGLINNTDALPDIAIADGANNLVSVQLNNFGDGTFKAPVTGTVGTAPAGIALGDFNLDKKMDLVVANFGSDSISVLLGNGDGTLHSAVSYAMGISTPSAVAVADLNGDGKPDLVVANSGTNNVTVYKGVGDGTFTVAQSFATGAKPSGLVLGDFNLDGNLDIAVSNGGDKTVSVLLGIGDLTFKPTVDATVGNAPSAVAVGDFNLDGFLDLATTDASDDSVAVILGSGDGTFQGLMTVSLGQGANPSAIVVADWNSDRLPDLAVTDKGTSSVSVLLNTSK